MLKKLQIIFVGLFLLLFLNACNKSVPLENPNFSVQAKTQQDVGNAVKTALVNRRWTIISNTASTYTAKYSRGKATATIVIAFSKSNVSIQLVSSENLLQSNEDGNSTIHKTYAAWIKNLEGDIYTELSYKM